MNQVDREGDDERVRLIRDSAAWLLGGLSRIRHLRFTAEGCDREIWRRMCALGWSGLRTPQAAGGSELGLAEYTALLEELGSGLVPEPLLPAVLAAGVLDGEALELQLSGERLVLPAFAEPLETRDGHVSGTLAAVPLARAADAFVVTLVDGCGLVEAHAPGLTLEVQPTQDGGHLGRLTLTDVPVQRLPVSAETLAGLQDEAALGSAAYLLGVMQGAFERTLDYLKVRHQFGRAIGSFQVLQHRMVDLKIQLELTRALVGAAARRLDEGADPAARRRAVSAAKVQAGHAALRLTREAIQLHGAIGYTDEADIGLFLRKVLVLMNAHGSVEAYFARYTDLICQEAR